MGSGPGPQEAGVDKSHSPRRAPGLASVWVSSKAHVLHLVQFWFQFCCCDNAFGPKTTVLGDGGKERAKESGCLLFYFGVTIRH